MSNLNATNLAVRIVDVRIPTLNILAQTFEIDQPTLLSTLDMIGRSFVPILNSQFSKGILNPIIGKMGVSELDIDVT